MSLVSGKNYTTEITSRKNMIINGNFDVWQRGTSFVTPTDGSYTADRWKFWVQGGGAVTVSRSGDVPSATEAEVWSNYSLKVDVTTADTSLAAGDYYILAYVLEGYDYSQMTSSNAVLSFWVKSPKTGTHYVNFSNDGLDRSFVGTYTVNVANTWEKQTIQIPLTETGGTWDYTNGHGLEIGFTLAVGSTYHTATTNEWLTTNEYAEAGAANLMDNIANDFLISQVQFEVGTEATEFERRHIADELAMCERYYETGYYNIVESANGAHLYGSAITYHVKKRDIPTITYTRQGGNNVAATTTHDTGGSGDGFSAYASASAAGFSNFLDIWEADAEI